MTQGIDPMSNRMNAASRMNLRQKGPMPGWPRHRATRGVGMLGRLVLLWTVVAAGMPALAQDIAAGTHHTCSTLADTSVACWGVNLSGQLGVGDDLSLRPLPESIQGLADVTALVAGVGHTCARRAEGSVYCWGANETSQLGLGDVFTRTTPVGVPIGNSVTMLAAGGFHTCALIAGGSVVCWGNNDYGQLGMGDTFPRSLPFPVPGLSDVIALTAGAGFTCALRSNGSVACWGRNSEGQLGLGDTKLDYYTSPQDLLDLSNVAVLAAGSRHVCAGFEDGSAACWGLNRWGSLGVGDTEDRSSPEIVPGLGGVTALAAGEHHTCARISDGSLSCWGNNADGQLGLGDRTQRELPVTLPELGDVTSVAAGLAHTCARRADGSLFCWGSNFYGQLGLGGIRDTELNPKPVSFEHLWQIFFDDFEADDFLLGALDVSALH